MTKAEKLIKSMAKRLGETIVKVKIHDKITTAECASGRKIRSDGRFVVC